MRPANPGRLRLPRLGRPGPLGAVWSCAGSTVSPRTTAGVTTAGEPNTGAGSGCPP